MGGQTNTFHYPILTSVTLICMATAMDGSPVNEVSYQWFSLHICDACFYHGNTVGQRITGNNLLAKDAGLLGCYASTGTTTSSAEITLQISGTCIYFCISVWGTYQKVCMCVLTTI